MIDQCWDRIDLHLRCVHRDRVYNMRNVTTTAAGTNLILKRRTVVLVYIDVLMRHEFHKRVLRSLAVKIAINGDALIIMVVSQGEAISGGCEKVTVFR